jgi:hypothetical protein
MKDLFGARYRVALWLAGLPQEQLDAESVLNTNPRGVELLYGDLIDLLAATTPSKPREAVLPKASSRVRPNNPSTSWEAAISVTSDTAIDLYRRIRKALLLGTGLTDEELVERMVYLFPSFNFSPSGLRSRRSELVEAGWVEDSGEKRPTRAGRPAIVWRVVVDS